MCNCTGLSPLLPLWGFAPAAEPSPSLSLLPSPPARFHSFFHFLYRHRSRNERQPKTVRVAPAKETCFRFVFPQSSENVLAPLLLFVHVALRSLFSVFTSHLQRRVLSSAPNYISALACLPGSARLVTGQIDCDKICTSFRLASMLSTSSYPPIYLKVWLLAWKPQCPLLNGIE